MDERIGAYTGELAAAYGSGALKAWLETLPRVLDDPAAIVLTAGRNRNILVQAPLGPAPVAVVVKCFGRQWAWRDWLAMRRGSKARRTWRHAMHLHQAGVGTPEPLAFMERWVRGRLAESYFVSTYVASSKGFGDELARLFREDFQCWKFMALFETVAVAIRKMHDAGFRHCDLGNQNILLHRVGDGAWTGVRFIDLNRGRISQEVSVQERAKDLSRIDLPSDFLRVFLEMYWAPEVPPAGFLKAEQKCRRAYQFHHSTRRWRHPFREAAVRRRQGENPDTGCPGGPDMWVWDERSGQAISTLRSRDRHAYIPWSVPARQVLAVCRDGGAVWREHQRRMVAAFGAPVEMRHGFGVAIDPRPATWERECALHVALGRPPVLVRFYHHEPQMWDFLCGVIGELHARQVPVAVALIQDRVSVREPARWKSFAGRVFDGVGGKADFFEIGHAINRVKWGVWNYREYRSMLNATAEALAGRPFKVTGPAGIDFEYPFVMAALREVPSALRFYGLSHHLYVDRRGAPENRQGRFALLEKLALARAMAAVSGVCEDRLIVSEVNWPLRGTGVYSPVGSPYESPGVRYNDPSVSEDEYADYMLRYLLIALTSGLADRVYWWRLVASGYGLVDDTDPAHWRERPAFWAAARFLDILGRARFLKRIAGPESACWFLFLLPSEETVAVGYAHPTECYCRPPFDYAEAVDALGAPVGRKGAALRLGGRLVYFRGVSGC